MDEIKRKAPGHRGKTEDFNPKIGQKLKGKTKSPNGPKSPELTPPSALDRNRKPTEQRNELLLAESIFSVDVTNVVSQSREDFSTSFAQLPHIAIQTYNQCSTDERQMDKILTRGNDLFDWITVDEAD